MPQPRLLNPGQSIEIILDLGNEDGKVKVDQVFAHRYNQNTNVRIKANFASVFIPYFSMKNYKTEFFSFPGQSNWPNGPFRCIRQLHSR